jgi:CRISPR-associated protein Csx17
MKTMTMTRHLLSGLRPQPLASYLAGLGLIRVLGEQADRDATAAWTPDGLAITTRVRALARWLADEYKPMPVLSPWNGGSGFGSKDKEPLRRLDTIRASSTGRLADLRAAIAVSENVVRSVRERAAQGPRGWVHHRRGRRR